VPLLPLLSLYRDYFGVSERDPAEVARERIEAATLDLDPAFAADVPLLLEFLGAPDPDLVALPIEPEDRQRRLREVLARAIEARSRREAAVVIVEDLQWIDGASAGFLETLVEAVVGTRTLLVTTFRHEHEAAWTGRKPHLRISLGPLDPEASGALLNELLGADPSLNGLQRLIEERTAGNPFFAEEAVQALADAGDLAGERGRYRLSAEIEALVLPPTVQAALASRIDVLPAREKALVQTMAVIGPEVPLPVLSAVSDLGPGELIESVEALTDAQMLVARGPAADAEYAFKHPLTQNVAYESQLSERRARTHRAIADAIERIYPDGLDERAALLAHHYEASGDGLAAAGWHARAAGWAERTSLAESLRHWRRARHLLGELAPSAERDALASRARVGILDMSWRLGGAREETAEIRAEARADAGEIALALVSAGTSMHGGREREGLEEFRHASRTALAGGDRGHVLTASLGVAYATWIAGSLREGLEVIDHALAIADGDPTTGSGVAFSCPVAHAHGDRARCLGYMGEIETARREAALAIDLARDHDDPETESAAHASIALVEAEVGEIEAALASAALGVSIAERAGNVVHAVACSTPAAVAEAGAGRFANALAGAESNLATIRRQGIGLYFEPLLLATIARSKLGLGEAAGALAAAEEAVKIAGTRGLTTCALSAPIALAEVLSAAGRPGAHQRIESVLGQALDVARASGARAFEPRIGRRLSYL
jgi:adenylate cyclase